MAPSKKSNAMPLLAVSMVIMAISTADASISVNSLDRRSLRQVPDIPGQRCLDMPDWDAYRRIRDITCVRRQNEEIAEEIFERTGVEVEPGGRCGDVCSCECEREARAAFPAIAQCLDEEGLGEGSNAGFLRLC